VARCTISFTRANVWIGPNSRHQYARNASSFPTVNDPPLRIEYPPTPIMNTLLRNPTARLNGKNRLRALIARTCCS